MYGLDGHEDLPCRCAARERLLKVNSPWTDRRADGHGGAGSSRSASVARPSLPGSGGALLHGKEGRRRRATARGERASRSAFLARRRRGQDAARPSSARRSGRLRATRRITMIRKLRGAALRPPSPPRHRSCSSTGYDEKIEEPIPEARPLDPTTVTHKDRRTGCSSRSASRVAATASRRRCPSARTPKIARPGVPAGSGDAAAAPPGEAHLPRRARRASPSR